MHEWLGYLTRSTGIVATALMLFALAWGFFFSARETGTRRRPNWWLDLHNGVGGLAMIFTGVHLVTAFADSDWSIRFVSIFVPGTASSSKTAITWGVLAFYGMVLTVFTSWPRRLFKRPVWRTIHLLSMPATVFAIVHAYQLGTDAHSAAFEILVPVAAAGAMYPLVLRVTKLMSAHSQRSPR
jgi:DMSO/TMAO reductase YedYZ heme-binding membrane subunit